LRSFFSASILLLVFLLFGKTEVTAQKHLACTTTFLMYEGGKGFPTENLITNVTAIAINTRGEKYAAELKDEMPHFPVLTENSYKFSFVKPGYATTTFEIASDCPENGRRPVNVYVPMWIGDTTTVRKFYFESLFERVCCEQAIRTVLSDVMEIQAHPERIPPRPKQISGGILNGKALSLPKPAYPAAAKAAKARGTVTVQVLIGEMGNVVDAYAVGGHPLLRSAAESAAREAKFRPTLLNDEPVKVSGIIEFRFR